MKITDLKYRKEHDMDLRKTAGDEAAVCPVCVDDRKKKTAKSLSWNHDHNYGMCHHCQTRFFIPEEKQQAKPYVRPVYNNSTHLSDKAVKWFQGRGISQEVLREARISEGPEWMPQTTKQENTIQFNYFRAGQLINTKFRDGKKNFKLVKDAELIFYNLDGIADQTTCVITEGEMDCLSWIQAGVKNVVSVPNGASKNSKLDYLDNCWEYFEGMEKIYISTDNDAPGRALRDELVRRLGIERCYKVEFGPLKDANEYLMAHGEEKLRDLLSEATEFPIEGVFTISETWEDLEDIWMKGLPQGDKTGDAALDSHIGFMPGELTMVTGIPGHGKSIYLDQLSLGLAINSGWKFGICSPESYPLAFYFARLIKRIIGKKFSKNHITPSQMVKVRDWLQDKYFMIMPENGFSLDGILDRAKLLVARKGINCLILDPWNRIEHGMLPGMNEGKWIVHCLTKIIEFAQRTGVHVFLVAHPTKMQRDKDGINYIVPNLYNISGSAHFFNITHNGLTVFRNSVSGKTEVHIQKVKWEHLGKVGAVEYVYNTENARFDSVLREDHTNWLDTKIYPDENKQTQMDMDDFLNQITDNDLPPF